MERIVTSLRESLLQHVITSREALFQENKRENKTKDPNDYSSFNDPNESSNNLFIHHLPCSNWPHMVKSYWLTNLACAPKN